MILQALREGSKVQRAHTIPHQGSYSVAEHSYNALCLLFILYQKIENTHPSYNLIQAVMYHDIPERWTGDVPAPAKWCSPALKRELDKLEHKILAKLGVSPCFNALTPYEKDWLKFVDLLELYMWCWDETRAGNGLNVQDTANRIVGAVSEMPGNFQKFWMDYILELNRTRLPELDQLLMED